MGKRKIKEVELIIRKRTIIRLWLVGWLE